MLAPTRAFLLGTALLSAGLAQAQTKPGASDPARWRPSYSFDATAFQRPTPLFAPFTRW